MVSLFRKRKGRTTPLVLAVSVMLGLALNVVPAMASGGSLGDGAGTEDACVRVGLSTPPAKPVAIRYGLTGGGEEPLALLWSEPSKFPGYGKFYTIDHTRFTPSQRVTAYIAGQIDAGTISFPGLVTAVARHVSLRAVALLVKVTPTDNEGAFVVRAGTPKAYKDLQSAKVGIYGPNTVSQYWIESAFHRAGVKAANLEFVALPPPAQEGALRNKMIKVAWLARQYLARAEKKGGVEVLGRPYDMVQMDQPSLLIFFSPEFVHEHPRAYCAWRADYQKAMNLWLTNTQQSIDVLVKSGYLTPAAAHAGADAGRDPDGEMSIANMASTIKDMVNVGFLRPSFVTAPQKLTLDGYALVHK